MTEETRNAPVLLTLTRGSVERFVEERLPQILRALPKATDADWLRAFAMPIAMAVLSQSDKVTDRTRGRIFAARVFAELAEQGVFSDDSNVKGIWEHAGTIVLNPFRGCNFGCVYCFRPPESSGDSDWFLRGAPVRVFEDDDLVSALVDHRHYTSETVVALHTATTDPFLPSTRKSTHELIRAMARRGLSNPIMIITKMPVLDEDLQVMAEARDLRFMLLLTYSAAPMEMETFSGIASIEQKRWESLQRVAAATGNVESAHYYRPIVKGWNDGDEQIRTALDFGSRLGLSVIGGIKPIDGIDELAAQRGLPAPAVDLANPGKQFTEELEQRVMATHAECGLESQIVKDQSCALTILLGRWGGLTPSLEAVRIRDELEQRANPMCTACSPGQLVVCSTPTVTVTQHDVDCELIRLGYAEGDAVLEDKRVIVRAHVSSSDAAFLQFRTRLPVDTEVQ
jgi:hypothetical protein